MEPPAPTSDDRTSRAAAVGTLVAAAVLVLAVVTAAVDGSWEMEPRFDLPQLTAPDVTLPAFNAELEFGDDIPDRPMIDLPWVGVLARLVVMAAVVGVLWWLWSRLRRHLPAWRTRSGEPAADAVGDGLPDLPTLEAGVVAARQHLDGPVDASDAIIAAWLSLETAAEASGVGRRPAQTPSEFTVAVLESTPADPDAIAALLAIYHRARFSGHPADAADVAEARRHLGTLAAAWMIAVTHEEANG